MELIDAIKQVSDKFVYTPDKTGAFMNDNWFIMREIDGKYYGDCEDYSLTVMYLLSGSFLGMLWNLFIGKYSLHIVASNGTSLNHCIGSIGDNWFDNWTLEAKSKDEFFQRTKHLYGRKLSFFTIASKLIVGKILGKK